eukprot:TRINITY_DN50857_c0_g1_i1.p1 TRINITY_DN50857_c0_g1~~TRINITY_DN50857_c0_g1_i1.p1  ORF type:complete len:108 (+),score=5.91 TRINITY_DN50857_c0_g1_i1:3-326(+)
MVAANVQANTGNTDLEHISMLFQNGTLKCAFGIPSRMEPTSDVKYCPPVYQFFGHLWVPFVWALLFLLTLAFCYWQGGKLTRTPQQSRIGRYLQIYGAGFRDHHLYG